MCESEWVDMSVVARYRSRVSGAGEYGSCAVLGRGTSVWYSAKSDVDGLMNDESKAGSWLAVLAARELSESITSRHPVRGVSMHQSHATE